MLPTVKTRMNWLMQQHGNPQKHQTVDTKDLCHDSIHVKFLEKCQEDAESG
jgi:hypothetical protein